MTNQILLSNSVRHPPNQSSPKKSRRLLRLTLIALFVLLVGMVIRIRPCDVVTPGAQALWNQNELYIVVEQNKVASSQNVWSFSWSLAKGRLGIPTAPSFHRIDCIVYLITSSKVEEHLAKGWHVAGTVAPYKGIPHAFIGGDRDAGVYRWTGNNFAKLSPSEALRASSGYTYTDELFKRVGWSRADLLPVRESKDYAVTLGGVQFTLRVTQMLEETSSKVTTASRIELINGSDAKSVRILYEFKDKHGLLSSSEYKRLTE